MILLNVICELRRAPGATKHLYEDIANTCVNDILFHVHIDKKAVLETVGMNGKMITPMSLFIALILLLFDFGGIGDVATQYLTNAPSFCQFNTLPKVHNFV